MSEASGPWLLALDEVHAYYGQSHVLQGVTLAVPEGSIVSLMGRNGAGKTTTLRCIMGLLRPRLGTILFRGENIVGLPVHVIARRGVSLVPEDRRIFSSLTVAENIVLGAGGRKDAIDEALGWFPALEKYLARPGDRLSGGEQQMLTIARALVAHPRLMLIDEPLEGLAPIIVEQIQGTLRALRGKTTIMLVEQSLKWLLAVADYHYVMNLGRIVYQGTSLELGARPDLLEQYLGVAA